MVWCDEDGCLQSWFFVTAHLPFRTLTPFPVRNVPPICVWLCLLVLLFLGAWHFKKAWLLELRNAHRGIQLDEAQWKEWTSCPAEWWYARGMPALPTGGKNERLTQVQGSWVFLTLAIATVPASLCSLLCSPWALVMSWFIISDWSRWLHTFPLLIYLLQWLPAFPRVTQPCWACGRWAHEHRIAVLKTRWYRLI